MISASGALTELDMESTPRLNKGVRNHVSQMLFGKQVPYQAELAHGAARPLIKRQNNSPTRPGRRARLSLGSAVRTNRGTGGSPGDAHDAIDPWR